MCLCVCVRVCWSAHLFDGSDGDDKEEREAAGDRTGGGVYDQLRERGRERERESESMKWRVRPVVSVH